MRELLDWHSALVQMRSPFVHRATLLHHVAANGIEVERQLQFPPNAAEIMRLLLEHAAEPDAVCDTDGGGRAHTTLYRAPATASRPVPVGPLFCVINGPTGRSWSRPAYGAG